MIYYFRNKEELEFIDLINLTKLNPDLFIYLSYSFNYINKSEKEEASKQLQFRRATKEDDD